MKTLILIRHAKSSRDNPALEDHQRPLAKRGVKDLPRMAARLQQQGWQADVCWSSTAVRARETARGIGPAISNAPLVYQDSLYTFNADRLAEQIRQAEDHIQQLAVVGHNPAMQELIEQLVGSELGRFPTCAVAKLSLDIEHWQQLAPGCGQLLDFDWPKRETD